MDDYIEVRNEVTCPYCHAANIRPTSGTTMDSYPPLNPYFCLNCQEDFSAPPFNLVKKSDLTTDSE